jgi:hypothetical protein
LHEKRHHNTAQDTSHTDIINDLSRRLQKRFFVTIFGLSCHAAD